MQFYQATRAMSTNVTRRASAVTVSRGTRLEVGWTAGDTGRFDGRGSGTSGQPPEMSCTFCLPALTNGIISRSSAPTRSIWCSWPAFFSAS